MQSIASNATIFRTMILLFSPSRLLLFPILHKKIYRFSFPLLNCMVVVWHNEYLCYPLMLGKFSFEFPPVVLFQPDFCNLDFSAAVPALMVIIPCNKNTPIHSFIHSFFLSKSNIVSGYQTDQNSELKVRRWKLFTLFSCKLFHVCITQPF